MTVPSKIHSAKVDMEITPRSREEVEAALQAIKELIVTGPASFSSHLIVVKDVLEKELEMRRGRGE